MSLSGTLQTMSLPDLLQWIHSARKTGTLALHGERHTKQIHVTDGCITSSSSNDPTEQLGQFLLSRGRITEEQLKKGLETQASTHVLLGKIFLMIGVLTEEDLGKLLQLRTEETIFSVFLWPDARFEFEDGVVPKDVLVPVALNIEQVLIKGLACTDELQHIRKAFGSSRTILARTDKPLPEGFAQDRSPAGAALALVDGRRTIADITLGVHASEFAVSKVLYQFFRQQFLRIVTRVAVDPPSTQAGGGPTTAESLVSRARQKLSTGDPGEALDLLSQAISVSPHEREIRSLYETASDLFKQQVQGNAMSPERVPFLKRDLDTLLGESLTPEEVFLISRINGSWDLQSIISISPLGEVEALRLLKKLKDRGILGLR